jgi:hypothetical protein
VNSDQVDGQAAIFTPVGDNDEKNRIFLTVQTIYKHFLVVFSPCVVRTKLYLCATLDFFQAGPD